MSRFTESALRSAGWRSNLRQVMQENARQAKLDAEEKDRREKQDAEDALDRLDKNYTFEKMTDWSPEGQAKPLTAMNIARGKLQLPELTELPAVKQRQDAWDAFQFEAPKMFAEGFDDEFVNNMAERRFGHDFHSSSILKTHFIGELAGLGQEPQAAQSVKPTEPGKPGTHEAGSPAGGAATATAPKPEAIPYTTREYWKSMASKYVRPINAIGDAVKWGEAVSNKENIPGLATLTNVDHVWQSYGDAYGIPRDLLKTNKMAYLMKISDKVNETKLEQLRNEQAIAQLKPPTADQVADNARQGQEALRRQLTAAEASLKSRYERGEKPNDTGMWGIRQTIYDLRAQLGFAGHKVGQKMEAGFESFSGTTVQQNRTFDEKMREFAISTGLRGRQLEDAMTRFYTNQNRQIENETWDRNNPGGKPDAYGRDPEAIATALSAVEKADAGKSGFTSTAILHAPQRIRAMLGVDKFWEGSQKEGYKPTAAGKVRIKEINDSEAERRRMGVSVVERANRHIGAPYKFGGENVASGIDCSAFVQQQYKGGGIKLPRTAAQQFSATKPVGTNQAQTGDLVFLKDTGGRKGITHVGIVDGNNVIQASSSKGKVVKSPLSTFTGSKRFAGARRVPQGSKQSAKKPSAAKQILANNPDKNVYNFLTGEK